MLLEVVGVGFKGMHFLQLQFCHRLSVMRELFKIESVCFVIKLIMEAEWRGGGSGLHFYLIHKHFLIGL